MEDAADVETSAQAAKLPAYGNCDSDGRRQLSTVAQRSLGLHLVSELVRGQYG